MFGSLLKKIMPKKDLSLVQSVKRFFSNESEVLENPTFSLQGTYNYNQVLKLNELTGNSLKVGYVPKLGPVAIIGIPNSSIEIKYIEDVWEYGKFRPTDKFEFQSYDIEQAKYIANYTVYGYGGIEKLKDIVKFDKINVYYDSRYEIKCSDKYRVFNMDCRLKGKFSYQLALDVVNHEDFRINGNSIVFARVGNKNIGIIGMHKDSICQVAGFRDVWEYGKNEPEVELITFLNDEQAKKNVDYILYYYNYILPSFHRRNYFIDALDRTIDYNYNFYESGKDFRLTKMNDLYRETLDEEYTKSGYYVNKDLNSYITNCILPEYEKFDKGHDIRHVTEVIFRSFKIISKLSYFNINCNIVYAVAAYHDLGIKINRKNHAHYSGIFVREDKKLKEFFSSDEIEIIAQAVEDHSTSLNKEPRNIYGKIVCDADKDDDYLESLKRAYEYTKVYFPEYTYEQSRDNCYEQLNKKFGKEGLVRYYILDENNSEFIKMMKKMAEDKLLFEKVFKEAIK